MTEPTTHRRRWFQFRLRRAAVAIAFLTIPLAAYFYVRRAPPAESSTPLLMLLCFMGIPFGVCYSFGILCDRAQAGFFVGVFAGCPLGLYLWLGWAAITFD